MNIYLVVKKRFFSKLGFLLVVAGLMFGGVEVGAQGTTAPVAPEGWKVAPLEDTYDRYIGSGDDMGGSTEKTPFNYLRGRQIYGSTGDQGKKELVDDNNFPYVGAGLNQKLGTQYKTDNIYSITTKVGGSNVTNYYASGAEFPDKQDRLIAKATKDGVIIPPQPLKKLTANQSEDAITDMSTEAGFNNWYDRTHDLKEGSTSSGLRNSDSSLGNRNRITQERDTAADEAKKIQDQIDAIDQASNGRDLTSQEQAQRDSLLSQRDNLVSQQELLERQRIRTTAAAQGDNINIGQACEGFKWLHNLDCWTATLATLFNIGMNLVAYALNVVGILFDYSIELAVNSAEFIQRIGVVDPTWTFVRDLLNMTFIFVLLWIAVHIILQKGSYTIKGDVVRVIVVAILINFSLFAAKAMVDGSNIVTLQLYQATKSDGTTALQSTNPSTISSRIMNTLGLASIYNFSDITGNATKTVEGCGDAHGAIIKVAIFGSIFMIIIGLAFLMVGILFFVRMANIVFLFITSPLWVWGHIMDQGVFATLKNNWWKRMMYVIRFPVVFMLFMFVAMFVFTKLFGISNGLNFLTLFCTADNQNMMTQLPLILNFCLVIWVILAAVKYSAKNTEGSFGSSITNKFKSLAEMSSIGLAKKLGNKVRDTGSKAGSMAMEGLKQAPKAALYTAGQLGKGTIRGLGGFKNLNKLGSTIAANGNAPAFVRNAAANLANRTKDPTLFGKTKKQWKEARNKWWAGNGAEDATNTAIAAETAITAPKYKEKGYENENEAAFRDRVTAFAKAKAKIYLDERILAHADPENSGKSHEEGLTEQAMQGVVAETDAAGNVTYRFNQGKMRDHLNNVYTAHAEGGRLAASMRHPKSRMMSNGKFKAREAAFKTQLASRAKEVSSLEKLKDDLAKAEANLQKHPEKLADLENLIKTDPAKLKGIISVASVNALTREIEKLKGTAVTGGLIKMYENNLQAEKAKPTPDPRVIDLMQTALDEASIKLEKKEASLKGIKDGAIKNRGNIKTKIEELKEKIKEAEKKG